MYLRLFHSSVYSIFPKENSKMNERCAHLRTDPSRNLLQQLIKQRAFSAWSMNQTCAGHNPEDEKKKKKSRHTERFKTCSSYWSLDSVMRDVLLHNPYVIYHVWFYTIYRYLIYTIYGYKLISRTSIYFSDNLFSNPTAHLLITGGLSKAFF